MSTGGWSCPHLEGKMCLKVKNHLCVPGMKGCVLRGKVTLLDQEPSSGSHPRGESGEGSSSSLDEERIRHLYNRDKRKS